MQGHVWVGMCGQMASDPLATILLVGLGLDEFSVAPAVLPGDQEKLFDPFTYGSKACSRECVGK